MQINDEQLLKLQRASALIAEVQIALLREDEQKPLEQRTGNWRKLYEVRASFNGVVGYLQKDPPASHSKARTNPF